MGSTNHIPSTYDNIAGRGDSWVSKSLSPNENLRSKVLDGSKLEFLERERVLCLLEEAEDTDCFPGLVNVDICVQREPKTAENF